MYAAPNPTARGVRIRIPALIIKSLLKTSGPWVSVLKGCSFGMAHKLSLNPAKAISYTSVFCNPFRHSPNLSGTALPAVHDASFS